MGKGKKCNDIFSIKILYHFLIILTIVCFITFIVGFCIISNTKENFGNQELKSKIANSALILTANPENLKHVVNPNINKIIAKDINIDLKIYGILNPTKEEYTIAEQFHKSFNKHESQRIKDLENLFLELGAPKTVITLFYCNKFFIFFENWVKSCEKNGIEIRDKTITFSLDIESFEKTKALGFKTFLLNYEKAGDSNIFGDSGFASAMFYKNAIMDTMLKVIPNGNYLLFQDSDLLWLNNPIQFLENNSIENNYDIQIMYDGPNPVYKNIYANTGFIFILNNSVTKSIFETALNNSAFIFASGSHQKILCPILEHYQQHNLLNLVILPETEFINGHLISNGTGEISNKLPSDWKSKAMCLHYSWTSNKADKFKKLRILGFDYIVTE
jgi:hypothetical protein